MKGILVADDDVGPRELLRSALATSRWLARVSLAQGSIAHAVAHVAGILADVQTATLGGAEEPVLVYLMCYQVLRAAGDPWVESVLKLAMPCGSSEQRSLSTPSGEPGFSTTSRLIAH